MNEMELQTTLDPIEMDMGDPEIVYSPVLPNPEGEPTDDLTKVTIQGNIYQIKDPEVHDWARAEEKPTYTKEEVGLGNVDNTSDMDKPVSTATQTALDNKVDKVAGKGLSTNDFTNDFKTKLEGIEAGAEVNTVNSVAGKTGNVTLDKSDVGLGNVDNTSDMNKPVSTATQEALQGLASATQTALNGKVDNSTLNNYYTATQTDNLLNGKVDKDGNKVLSDNNYSDTDKSIVGGVTSALADKVDKVEGYGLSKNDYTDEEKAKVGEIDNKLDKTETAVNSNGLVIATPVTDTAPYIYRQTPVKESFKALMKKIVGASVVWNQIMPYGNYASMEGIVSLSGSSTSVANNTATCVVSANFGGFQMTIDKYEPTHKYLVSSVIKTSADRTTIGFGLSDASSHFKIRKTISTTTSFAQYCFVGTMTDTETGTLTTPRFMIFDTQGSQGVTIDIQKSFAVDLTAMFGTTIADYVYTLETSQSGSGIAWLQSYGFFTEDYYAYKQNKLESGCVSAKKVTNFNQWDEVWEVGGINATTGANQTRTDRIRSKNIYKVLNTTYYLSMSTDGVWVYRYDSDKNYLGRTNVVKNSQFTPNCSYIRFETYAEYGITYKNDICINISDTAKNGTYAPYVEPTTYPISPITLRGLFKLSTDKLTVDGDEYNADGSVTRKYGIVDLGTLDWTGVSLDRWEANYSGIKGVATNNDIANIISNNYIAYSTNALASDTTLIGMEVRTNGRLRIRNGSTTNTPTGYLIYELATPTTEQTTPFTETEIVGSTEEFIDYEVAQGNRDVAIPVGTETDYYQEMKLPSLPTTSGNHNLIYNIATGFGWS